MENVSVLHRLEYIGYITLEKFISRLPNQILPIAAKSLALLTYRILKIRRQVARENLKRAFPNKTHFWLEKTAYRSYQHFALVILEFMKMRVWEAKYIYRLVEPINTDEIIASIENGNGGILVSGHYGNWEIGIGYFHAYGIKSSVIQQRQQNPLVNLQMKTLRENWGMEIIYPRGAVTQSVKAIRKNRIVALLGDQDAGKKGVFVPFFNWMSSTHVGAALICLRSKAPLFFASCTRSNTGKFELKIKRLPDREISDDTQEAVEEITKMISQELQKVVEKHPEQYFWMHRRWKTPYVSQ